MQSEMRLNQVLLVFLSVQEGGKKRKSLLEQSLSPLINMLKHLS